MSPVPKLPDLVKDHAAWLKWYLSESWKAADSREKWWLGRSGEFKGSDLEWDKTRLTLLHSSWDMRLHDLKMKVWQANLETKNLDIVLTKEFRDVLAIHDEQVKVLAEALENTVNKMGSQDPSPKEPIGAPTIRISKKSYYKKDIGSLVLHGKLFEAVGFKPASIEANQKACTRAAENAIQSNATLITRGASRNGKEKFHLNLDSLLTLQPNALQTLPTL